MESRKQYTFYASFREAAKHLKKKQDRADFYDAVCDYALYGIEFDIDQYSDAVSVALSLVKPVLDASRRKAQSGKAGGSTKQTASKPEANGKHPASKKEIEKEKEIENKNEIEIEYKSKGADKPPTRARFTAPSVDDVRGYCQEQGYTAVDPGRFVDYYTANGWKVGKNPMKDWRAAVRGWNSREQDSGNYRKSKPGGTGERSLDADEMAAIRRMMEDDSDAGTP